MKTNITPHHNNNMSYKNNNPATEKQGIIKSIRFCCDDIQCQFEDGYIQITKYDDSTKFTLLLSKNKIKNIAGIYISTHTIEIPIYKCPWCGTDLNNIQIIVVKESINNETDLLQ